MRETTNAVLFVDDEQNVLNAIRRATDNENYRSLFATSGKTALEIMEKNEISVIVSDMRMPEMDGLTLLRQVLELYPKTVRIVLSGYTQLSQILATINRGEIFQFIAKPWQMEEELLTAVRQGIARFNLEAERDELIERLERKNRAYQNIFNKMEEKFAYEAKVLKNIKRVQRWTFSYWKRHSEVDVSEYIDFIEVAQLMYLNLFPANAETKSIEKMGRDIAAACSNRVSIQTLGEGECTFTGYHSFLLMSCKILINIIAPEPGAFIPMVLQDSGSGSDLSEVTLKISVETLLLSVLEKNKLIIGCSLLSEMSELYAADILLKTGDEKIDSLQLTLRSKGAELPRGEIDGQTNSVCG